MSDQRKKPTYLDESERGDVLKANPVYLITIVLAIWLVFVFAAMADDSPRIGIELMESGEAQPHITFNDFVLRTDALIIPFLAGYPADVNPVVNDPSEGDLFIVPTGGEGDWDNQDGELAYYQNAAWEFISPATGWMVHPPAQAAYYLYRYSPIVYTGSAWININAQVMRGMNLGNTDPGAGVTWLYNFGITYDSKQAVFGSVKPTAGPMIILNATSGETLFRLAPKSQGVDNSLVLYMNDAITNLGQVHLSTFAMNYLMQPTALGHCAPQAVLHSASSTILGVSVTENEDSDLWNGQVNLFLNESGDGLVLKVKYSNGTIKHGTVTLQ